MRMKSPRGRAHAARFFPEFVTVPLLLSLTTATLIWAILLFPSREPLGRGADVELTLVYDETPEERPDVEVDIVHDDDDSTVSIRVSFYVYGEDEPPSFELYVYGAPAPEDPDQIGFTLEPKWDYVEDFTSSFIPLPGGVSNWVAEVKFAGYPDSGFTDNGQTILGKVTAAKIQDGGGVDGRLDTATLFWTADAAELYLWSGRVPRYGAGDFVGFVVTADEEITSEEQLHVTGFNASAAQLDDRKLFMAGALVGVAGGAFTAAITEGARLAADRRRSERHDV